MTDPAEVLAERLQNVRHGLFVGRQEELADLVTWLETRGKGPNVLYLSGPGGIGKTTLCLEFSWICASRGVGVRYIDCASIDPIPQVFQAAVAGAGDAFEVLIVDCFEQLRPLDRWLVEHFLPSRPSHTLLVIAGRQPPSAVWKRDAGLQQLTHHRTLQNFSSDESNLYLERRQVPPSQRAGILSFTHGHPLAVALAADAALQRGTSSLVPVPDPDMLKTLLEHFIHDIPSSRHRTALEGCALVHRTTEGVLETLLGGDPEDVHDLFDWLRGLSFVDSRPDGLVPHDIVREVLVSELRWRHPDWYAELHRRARVYYQARMAGRPTPAQVFDLMFLHRDNPMVRPFLEWKKTTDFIVDSYRPEDQPALLEMTRRHEGDNAAEALSYWLRLQPGGVQVVRDSAGLVQGFFTQLALHHMTPAIVEVDPVTQRVYDFMQTHCPLRGQEEALYCRFWMDAAVHQQVSAVQSRIFLTFVVQALSLPQLAFSAQTVLDVPFWTPAFAYAAATLIDDESRTFYHDWRRLPPYAWLELLGRREIDPQASLEPTPELMSQEDFFGAVKEALKVAGNAQSLALNPLVAARFVVAGTGAQASALERGAFLQGCLTDMVESLKAMPRDAKLYRSLVATYFDPAETQELAAQRLDLPFSTYRRHLTAGVARLQEMLWQRELRR